jgi:hypothetical protein
MAQFKRPTTTDLITNGKYSNAATGTIIETLGYTTKGDGGAAQWKKTGVTGLTASQTPAQRVDAKLNDALGHEWEIVRDSTGLTPNALGAIGDGVADDSSVIIAWATSGGYLSAPDDNTYMTTAFTFTSTTKQVDCPLSTVFKLISEPPVGAYNLCNADGLSDCLIRINCDFNSSLINLASTNFTDESTPWIPFKGENLANVELDVISNNGLYPGSWVEDCTYLQGKIVNLGHLGSVVLRCDDSISFSVYARNLDNRIGGTEIPTNNHVHDILECEGGEINAYIVDCVASQPAGWSTFYSGVTWLECKNLKGVIDVESMDGNTTNNLKVLCASLHGNIGCTFNARLIGQAVQHLESMANPNCSFIVDIDGQYKKSDAVVNTVGLNLKDGHRYRDVTTRSGLSGGSDTLFSGIVRRCYNGAFVKSPGYNLKDLSFYGCANVSLWHGSDGSSSSVVSSDYTPRNVVYENVDSVNAGVDGYRVINGDNVAFLNCNSQGAANLSAGNGMIYDSGDASALALAGMKIIGGSYRARRKEATLANGISFDPAASSEIITGTIFPNQFRITMLSPNALEIGEGVTLKSVATGADLLVYVMDIDRDEVIVSTASPTSLTDNLATTLTGTLSSVGTAVTGTGTAFLTEIEGSAWIKAPNGEFRQVAATASNTALTLTEAFSSDQSGTYSIIMADIAYDQAPTYNLKLDEAGLSDLSVKIDESYGGSTQNMIVDFTKCIAPCNILIDDIAVWNGSVTQRTVYTSLPEGWIVEGAELFNDGDVGGGGATGTIGLDINDGGSLVPAPAVETVDLSDGSRGIYGVNAVLDTGTHDLIVYRIGTGSPANNTNTLVKINLKLPDFSGYFN